MNYRAQLLVAFGLALAVGAPAAAAGPLLLQPDYDRGITKRQQRHTWTSLKSWARRLDIDIPSRRVPDSGCGKPPACFAGIAAAQKAESVIGIVVTKDGGKFGFEYTLVSPQGDVLAEHRNVVIGRKKLKKEPGPELRKLLEKKSDTPPAEKIGQPPAEPMQPEDPEQALVITPPEQVIGDGHSRVEIEVSGGPPARDGENRRAPELPYLACKGASSIAASDNRGPGIIAPFVSEPTALPCRVSWRGAQKDFELSMVPPTAPGLYIELKDAPVVATPHEVLVLQAHIIDDSGTLSQPEVVFANTTAGDVVVSERGEIYLRLPRSRAPRAVALAATDGLHTGATFIPVGGKTRLRVKAERGSKVSVRIAGRSFGPVRARKRRVRIPIEVPPGRRTGVVRGERRGSALESMVNLRPPRHRRIAAVPLSTDVAAKGLARLLVAAAAPDGGPAASGTDLKLRVKKGKIDSIEAIADGLWIVHYRAPPDPTTDRVTVHVSGDRAAGRMRLTLPVVTGTPELLHVSVVDTEVSPGEVLRAFAHLRDAAGNLIESPKIEATLEGVPVEVEAGALGARLALKIPGKLPADGKLDLVVRARGVESKRTIAATPEAVAETSIDVRTDRRTADIQIRVVDEYGNLVPESLFQVQVMGADLEPLSRQSDHYSTRATAGEGFRSATIQVRTEDGVESATMSFSPPPTALLLGAYGELGATMDPGIGNAGRAGAGLFARRSLLGVEAQLSIGGEGLTYSDSETAMLGGAERTVDWSIVGWAVPVILRARLGVISDLGVSAAFRLAPSRVQITTRTDFQPPGRHSEWLLGSQGRVAVDWDAQPFRISIGAALGRSQLDRNRLTGNLDQFSLFTGLEYWFFDTGR